MFTPSVGLNVIDAVGDEEGLDGAWVGNVNELAVVTANVGNDDGMVLGFEGYEVGTSDGITSWTN